MATPEEQKAAADKAAADKATADQKAAADRALEAQKAAAEELNKEPVVIVGGPGAFAIYGRGLGEAGTLSVGGQLVKTTKWADGSIRGQLPDGLKGDVVLTTSSGVRHGVYPSPPKPAAQSVKVDVTIDGKQVATTPAAPPTK